MTRYLLLVSLLLANTSPMPLLAKDTMTNDELAKNICETRSKKDCKDAKRFMKIIESRKAAKRIVKQLSGSAKLVAEAQVHFSKKTKVIYVSLEDTINGVYIKSETTYTRSGQFSSWKKS